VFPLEAGAAPIASRRAMALVNHSLLMTLTAMALDGRISRGDGSSG
jgi:hypothetical protein